jgi:hypothetical protein
MNTPTWLHRRKAALRGRAGSMRDMIFSAVVLLILATAVSICAPNGAAILNATGSQAERQAAVAALVADKRATVSWGSVTTPAITDFLLPSGLHAPIALWTVPDTGGLRYEALVPKSRSAAAGTCSTSAQINSSSCIHAELFRAYDATTLVPTPIVRMDPSLTQAVGVVDPNVSTGTALATGTAVATASASTPRAWRYLLNAASTRTSGEIRIVRAGQTLATIPLTSTAADYFGTIVVAAGSPVTVTVSDGTAIVTTVLIYDAGAAS